MIGKERGIAILSKVLILVLCLLFGACSNTVSIKVSNIEKSNLNNRSDDVPVTFIVYKLKSVERFEEASDRDLITREDGVLGKDKIDSIRLQVAPKNELVAIKVKDKEVPYIGILVLFANDTKKITKAWVKTKDASGFWNKKMLKFQITQEGIRRL